MGDSEAGRTDELLRLAEETLAGAAGAMERTLEGLLPGEAVEPSVLHRAMRYSTLGGGKRLRAALTMSAAKAVAGGSFGAWAPSGAATVVAAAIEMIHAYSLVHDDLPCMDDDDFRRGRPSNHRVFGEAVAMLAGDSLLTQAFISLARLPEHGLDPGSSLAVMRCVAEAAGSLGMAGGQAMDLAAEGIALDLALLAGVHRRKTGALITASVQCGGIVAGASVAQNDALVAYGRELGLAFQIIDDMLDVVGEEAKTGKKSGGDARRGKATYPALVGLEQSRELAREARDRALGALEVFGGHARELEAFAFFVTARNA